MISCQYGITIEIGELVNMIDSEIVDILIALSQTAIAELLI
jgi:hypothetical protein